ncbi:terminase [Escherichia coli]|nr:terminase [Escherichia coli]
MSPTSAPTSCFRTLTWDGSRALKKADSAAAPEDASAQQAQDESNKSKKTTRKPATRKTTATQKAKRG